MKERFYEEREMEYEWLLNRMLNLNKIIDEYFLLDSKQNVLSYVRAVHDTTGDIRWCMIHHDHGWIHPAKEVLVLKFSG